MNKFKIGDKVRCINSDPEGRLTRGKAYVVSRVDPPIWTEILLVVEGIDLQFWASRFEKVSPNGKK